MVIKWYNIPFMHFATLTLEADSLNHADNRFSSKNWKIKFFIFFFKIIQYPFNGIFQINFYVRVPLNNTKNHFHKEKNPKNRFLYFYQKIDKFNGIFQINFLRARTLIPKTIFITKKMINWIFIFFSNGIISL